MTTIGLSSSDRAANAKKPPRDDDDDAHRPRSLLSNRPPRPFCPPQKRLLFHPPTQSVFFFFKGRRRLDSNPIAPNLPLLLLALFALLLLLLVDAHPLIVIDERSIIRALSCFRCLLRHFCFSLSLFLSSQKTTKERRGASLKEEFFILMFRVYRFLSKP